jgi:hypothetical protein
MIRDDEAHEVALGRGLARWAPPPAAEGDVDATGVGRRLHGVHQEIHERLLHLVLVGRYREWILAEIGDDRDRARARDDCKCVDGATAD